MNNFNEAVFQQSNGMFAVNIVSACGVFTPEQFEGLGRAARDCGVFRLKLTTRQTVVALLDKGSIPALKERLQELNLVISPYGGAVRAVKACAGNEALCPRALGDALDLGILLQEKFLGRETVKDIKIAVAGCSRGCTDPLCADFGVIARAKDRYDVFLGGRGGTRKPLHGNLLAENVTGEDVFKLLEHLLEKYSALAQPKERLAVTVARVGIHEFAPPEGLISPERNNTGESEFLAFLSGKEEI